MISTIATAAAFALMYYALKKRAEEKARYKHTIKSLHIYPVKSLQGIEVKSWPVDKRGFVHDRRWLIVREEDKMFISQRQLPKLALIETKVTLDGTLTLKQGDKSFTLKSLCYGAKELPQGYAIYDVTIFDRASKALDCGDDVANFLSDLIGKKVRLVETLIEEQHTRKIASSKLKPVLDVHPEVAKECTFEISFADGFPFLITNEASLKELNKKVNKQFEMKRFRPNIVIDSSNGFEEDSFFSIDVLKLESEQVQTKKFSLYNISPCTRCAIITVDPSTGVADSSITPLVSSVRGGIKYDGKPLFGIKVCHDTLNQDFKVFEKLEVGDIMNVTQFQEPPKIK